MRPKMPTSNDLPALSVKRPLLAAVFNLLIIIGGLGSIFGSFAGAAFLVLLPVLLKVIGVDWFGWPTDIVAHLNLVIVGGLIVIFLIAEPHGLAQLWRVAKEKLRLWPFPH